MGWIGVSFHGLDSPFLATLPIRSSLHHCWRAHRHIHKHTCAKIIIGKNSRKVKKSIEISIENSIEKNIHFLHISIDFSIED